MLKKCDFIEFFIYILLLYALSSYFALKFNRGNTRITLNNNDTRINSF